MGSNPELRERLVAELKERGVVQGDTLCEVKRTVGMTDVSNTQFGRALRSLHYNPGPVCVTRPRQVYFEPRSYIVTYRAS